MTGTKPQSHLRCIEACDFLTDGKTYYGTARTSGGFDGFDVVNDEGDRYWYSERRFEVLSPQ